MEVAKLIVRILEIIIWPTLVLIIILMFRKQILALIASISKATLPGGIEIEIREQEIKVKAKIEESAEELIELGKEAGDDNARKEEFLIKRNQIIKGILSDIPSANRQQIEAKLETEIGIKEKTMLAVAAGKSWQENLQYNLYYDPVSRRHNTPFKYLALYNEQAIRYVGEVTKVVCCNLVNGKLIATNGDDLSKLTQEEYARIAGAIENSHYEPYDGHKFHLVDNFYPTSFEKITPYGILSKKYFWLNEVQGFRAGMSALQVAEWLNGKTWE